MRLRSSSMASDVKADRAIDLSVYSSGTLSFDFKGSWASGGTGTVLVSGNGSNFSQIGSFTGSAEGSRTFTIPSNKLTSNFKLRFRVKGTGTNDMYIDNVVINVQGVA